jgi:hypothetical protein
MLSYGDSLSLSPPIAGVYGRDWLNLVAKELILDRFSTYAVGGSDTIGIAYHVISGNAGAGLPAAASGARFDSTRRGIVTLTCGLNDATATKDRFTGSRLNPSAIDAATISGLTGALRAILATFSHATRVEVENATLTGVWTDNAQSSMSNGHSRFTTVPGATAAFAVNVPATGPLAGKVFLMAHSLDPNTYQIASFDILVDGQVVKSVSRATVTMRGQKTSASVTLGFAPCGITVPVPAGNHTVTVKHTGANGEMVSLDFVAVPSTTPVPILHLQEYDPQLGSYTQADINIIEANRLQLKPAYAAVLAEFPNVRQVSLAAMPPGGISTVDGLHPNERGAIFIKSIVADGIRSLLASYQADNMYSGLGSLISPTVSQLFAGPGAWPATSGTDVKLNTRSMICIYGGVVTAINIDGVATGLTSGTFLIKAGHRMSVTYTTVPNYTNWDAAA